MRPTLCLCSFLVAMFLLASLANAQLRDVDPTKPIYDYDMGNGRGRVRIWRLHVIDGAPYDTNAFYGEWVHIRANVRKIPPGCSFGGWLPKKDLKVQDRANAETLLLMPDRHVDIKWTLWCASMPGRK